MSVMYVLGALTFVVAVGGYLVLRFGVQPRQIARYHGEVAELRCVPGPPAPGHVPLQPLAHEYEALGYRLDSYVHVSLGGEAKAITLLVGPDLSVADLAVRSDGPASSITTLLSGGAVLETIDRQTTPSAPGRLLQVFPGGTVPALVRRHQEGIAWLAGQGVTPVAHPNGAAGVIEQSAHLLGRQPPPSPAEVAVLAKGTATRHLGPVADQADIGDQLREAGLLGV